MGQLARAVDQITGARRAEVPFDLRGIQRIYPVLVTLDPIIEEPNIRGYLVEAFDEKKPSGRRPTITPVFVLHISDIEWMLAFTRWAGLAELLRDFTQGRPNAKYFGGNLMADRESAYHGRGWRAENDAVRARHEDLLARCREWLTT